MINDISYTPVKHELIMMNKLRVSSYTTSSVYPHNALSNPP